MAKGVKTGGRKKGTPNKVTADLRALAEKHGKEAVKAVLTLARSADNENTRLAAWRELLDRGFGKAVQGVEHSGPGGGPVETKDVSITELARRLLFLLGAAAEATQDQD